MGIQPFPSIHSDISITRGFTLVELLIVVTIIAIIGISSISGFTRMLDLQDAETTIQAISTTLDSYDRDIVGDNLRSYDTLFETGSLGFSIHLDWYQQQPFLEYSFNFETGTGIIKSTGTSGVGIIETLIYTDGIEGESNQLTESGGTQFFGVSSEVQKKQYSLISSLENKTLNSFAIQYYNLFNTDNLPEKDIRLVSITDENGLEYSSLLIRNVREIKTFEGSGATLEKLDKVILTFEKNGKEMQLTLQNK